ncbi:unnamed protein product [Closterium sp. NIES-64]|nr:unnamed protein product [Closterium sp. NIES-64]
MVSGISGVTVSDTQSQSPRFHRSLVNASLHIASLRIASLHIASLHIASLHIASLHIASLHIATFAKGSPMIPRPPAPPSPCLPLTHSTAAVSFRHHWSSESIPSLSSPPCTPCIPRLPHPPVGSTPSRTTRFKMPSPMKFRVNPFDEAFTSGVFLFAKKFPRGSPTLDRIDRELLQRQPDSITPDAWCSLPAFAASGATAAAARQHHASHLVLSPCLQCCIASHIPLILPYTRPPCSPPILPFLLAGSYCSDSLTASRQAPGALSLPSVMHRLPHPTHPPLYPSSILPAPSSRSCLQGATAATA